MIAHAADDAKRALRALVTGARPGGDVAALRARLLGFDIPASSVVGCVWPLRDEPDLRAAWSGMHASGQTVAFPETTPKGSALIFRHWTPGIAMRPGRFGTEFPDGEPVVPDVVFVPLLAWDLELNRLGYGGGYYDRTLAALPAAKAVGFGFEAQRLDRVPTGPHDVALHAMVTEARTLHSRNPSDESSSLRALF